MPWLQLSLICPGEQAEPFAALLETAGAISITYEDAEDEPQLEPGPGETPLWSRVRVLALFDADPAGTARVQRIASTLTERLEARPGIERIEDRVWERVWLDDFRPMRFGQRLWVCPAGQSPGDPQGILVTLDPGLAFGTGHHATTALCLEWLEGAVLAGKTLLDYGCGSGILAIAALRLGAAHAIAVDHDPQALEATRQNAAANRVADRLAVYPPEELPALAVDCALANILAGTLVSLAPSLAERVRAGGDLALSGVLPDQIALVCAAYEGQFQLDAPRIREDWALIGGRRKPTPSERVNRAVRHTSNPDERKAVQTRAPD